MEGNKKSIYTKLLEFQKKNISIVKSETNPHFRNKYADINEVLGKIKPALSECGLVLTQVPDANGLRTLICDPDTGETIEGYLEFSQKADPQKLGGNITYYRRYSLVSMLGLEDEDDDGNAAPPPAAKAPVAAKRVPISHEQAMKMLAAAVSLPVLQNTWKSLSVALKKDPEVLAMKDERKEYLTNQERG